MSKLDQGVENMLKSLARKDEAVAALKEKVTRVYMGKGITNVATHLSEQGYTTAAFVANPIVNFKIVGLTEEFDSFHKGVNCAAGDCGARLNRLVLEGIRKMGGEPWFCYIHYMDVHFPYDPPEEYAARFHESYAKRPKVTVEWLRKIKKRSPSEEELDYIIAMYDASLAYLDSQISALLESLTVNIPVEDLLIVVASDHGDEFYEHGDFVHGQSLYQELTRCPLILTWPGHIPKGGFSDEIVQNIDIVPTILTLVGAEIPDGIEGISLAGFLNGETSIRTAFSEMQGKSVWNGSWKLWKDHVGNSHLFDLDSDPEETRNLARAYPETLGVLLQQLDQWQQGLSVPDLRSRDNWTTALDSSLVQMLHDLGYVE